MRPILLAGLVLLSMAAPAALPAQDLDAILARFNAARKTASPEIATYMDRAEGCWHFAGEEPYSAARRAEINRALSELKCTTLKADGQALRRKYARSAPAIEALDAAAALE